MRKFAWLVARLSRMPAREWFHRAKERLALVYLSRRPEARTHMRLKLQTCATTEVPKIADPSELSSIAGKTMSGVEIYGYHWPRNADTHLAWLAFLNGEDTAADRALKVSYRDRGLIQDDIRLPWELNRLTWLIPVAAAACSGDGLAKEFLLREVSSFLDTDRPGYSLRWNSAIELAIQCISLLLMDSWMAANPEWTKMRPRVEWALAHRRRWLEKWPSRYSSANNHRLAELVALVALSERSDGATVPEKWTSELQLEIGRQFLDDGFNAELSFGYHLFALDLLVTLSFLAPKSSLLVKLESTLKLVGTATLSINQFCDCWPSANDSDEAVILGALTTRERLPEWLAQLAGANKPSNVGDPFTLIKAGYTFMASTISGKRATVVFDHGAIGYGQIAAHGHSDVLAVWLSVDGEPWLAESGTYCYHSDVDLRNLLRSSQLHNTIAINGKSLSAPLGPFLWNPANCASGRLISSSRSGGSSKAVAEAIKNRAVIAKRSIELSPGNLQILDSGNANDLVESFFIISPRFELAWGCSDQKAILRDVDGSQIHFTVSPNARILIDRVPFSPGYGKLTETIRLTVRSATYHSTTIGLYPVL